MGIPKLPKEIPIPMLTTRSKALSVYAMTNLFERVRIDAFRKSLDSFNQSRPRS